MSIVTLFNIVLAFLISPKLTEKQKNLPKVQLRVLLKAIPKFLFQPFIKIFLGYLIITRFFFYLTPETIFLKFINHGIERSTLVNLETCLIPFTIFIKFFSIKFVRKGNLMTYYHYIKFFSLFMYGITFINLITFINDGNKSRAQIIYFITKFFLTFELLDWDFIFSFSNIIIEEKYGSTGFTVIFSIAYIMQLVPTTIGFKIVKYFNYDIFVLGCFLIYLVLWFVSYPVARKLDYLDPQL